VKLTPELLLKVKQIIEKHHAIFIADVVGPEMIDPDLLLQLKEGGFLEGAEDEIEAAYLLGQLSAKIQGDDISSWSFEKVKAELGKNPIPLSAAEKTAVERAKNSAALYMRGLGNVVEKETGQILIEADKDLAAELRDKVRTQTAENVAKRDTVKTLKSRLGHAMGEWTRNLDRVAITEKHNAMQEGVADGFRKLYGDDPRVFIRTMPDACKHCIRLHNGPDGAPRIFRLSQLAGSGANVGKKPADWIPSTGSVHPHCQCVLHHIPTGYGFDESGDLVPGGEFGVEWGEKSLAHEERHLETLEKAMHGTLDAAFPFQHLSLQIENGPGSLRWWRSRHGDEGFTVMQWPYGFIVGVKGADHEEVDCYVGPNPAAEFAFVVHQRKKTPDGFGGYDEDKVMLGFSSEAEAREAYLAHYTDPRFLGAMSRVPMVDLVGFLEQAAPPKLAKSERLTMPNPAYVAPVGPRAPLVTLPAHPPGLRLTVPLVKAQGVSTLGENVQLEFAPTHIPKPTPNDGRNLIEQAQAESSTMRVKRDPTVYEIPDVRPTWVVPLADDGGNVPGRRDDEEAAVDAEENTEALVNATAGRKSVPTMPGHWSSYRAGEDPPDPHTPLENNVINGD